jgi:hypothetical protein
MLYQADQLRVTMHASLIGLAVCLVLGPVLDAKTTPGMADVDGWWDELSEQRITGIQMQS